MTERLLNSASVYTAELYTIFLSLMKSVNNNINITYFSDSVLSLQAIVNKKFEHIITCHILLKYHNLSTKLFNIIFCLLPSHVGITSNEKANKAAKYALNKPILHIPVPYAD